MKFLEIEAYSANEASIEAASQGLTVIKNATNYWESKNKPLSKKYLANIMSDYMLNHKYFSHPGSAVLIEVTKPNKLTLGNLNVEKFFKRVRTYPKRHYLLRCSKTKELLEICLTKKEAINASKDYLPRCPEGVEAKVIFIEKDINFKVNPGMKSNKGLYYIFGAEMSDLKLVKKQAIDF